MHAYLEAPHLTMLTVVAHIMGEPPQTVAAQHTLSGRTPGDGHVEVGMASVLGTLSVSAHHNI
jgi:hypothetical protein